MANPLDFAPKHKDQDLSDPLSDKFDSPYKTFCPVCGFAAIGSTRGGHNSHAHCRHSHAWHIRDDGLSKEKAIVLRKKPEWDIRNIRERLAEKIHRAGVDRNIQFFISNTGHITVSTMDDTEESVAKQVHQIAYDLDWNAELDAEVGEPEDTVETVTNSGKRASDAYAHAAQCLCKVASIRKQAELTWAEKLKRLKER
jgi:hypothetical protein